jgi:hypothetical protein
LALNRLFTESGLFVGAFDYPVSLSRELADASFSWNISREALRLP